MIRGQVSSFPCVCFLLFCAYFLGFASHAFAQEKPIPFSAPLDQRKTLDFPSFENLDRMMPSMREEVLSEAERIYTQCAYGEGMQKHFYHCECIALHYLNQRLLLGPDAHQSTLMLNITSSEATNRECVNPVAVAGHHWELCNLSIRDRSGAEKERLCACFANRTTEIFMEYPVYGPAIMVGIPTRAYRDCGR